MLAAQRLCCVAAAEVFSGSSFTGPSPAPPRLVYPQKRPFWAAMAHGEFVPKAAVSRRNKIRTLRFRTQRLGLSGAALPEPLVYNLMRGKGVIVNRPHRAG